MQQATLLGSFGHSLEVGLELHAGDVGGLVRESLEEHLVGEQILRHLLHHVEALQTHLAKVSEDVDLVLLLGHLQHRVDQYEGAGAADARRAMHQDRRLLLVEGRRSYSIDEADQRARIQWHGMVGPRGEVILHQVQLLSVLLHQQHPNGVVGKQLRLLQGHLDRTIVLTDVGPIFLAFRLSQTKKKDLNVCVDVVDLPCHSPPGW